MFRIDIFCNLAEDDSRGYVRCPDVRLIDCNDE